MARKRTFLAIDLGEKIRAQLISLQQDLVAIAGDVKMVESRNGFTRDEMTLGGFAMISVAGPEGAWTSQAGISRSFNPTSRRRIFMRRR